jgi:hypothetical protein
MTAVSDRATVSLALECASRLPQLCSTHGIPLGNGGVDLLLTNAETILAWIDRMCAERAKRDSVRANAPKIALPNMTA